MGKAVFFDFDGTLTYKGKNIWKSIWQTLGYDTNENSYYISLLNSFMTNQITHQQWCDLTCDAYVKKGMNIEILNRLVKNIKLIDGAVETFKELKKQGFSLHIVSGNIIDAIEKVLGQNIKYFDSINANDFYFDDNNFLTYIKGTKYDFEGKAKFINEYKQITGAKNEDLYFVGNGNNDEWAHLSGCNTICINPEKTEQNNQVKWHKTLENVTNLTDILPLILTGDKIKDKYEQKV